MIQPATTNLQPEDLVLFYPSFGHLVEGGTAWRIQIRGTVYALRDLTLRHRLMVRMLRRAMRASPQAMESPTFAERIQLFAAITERDKRLAVQIGDTVFRLQNRSKRNGHFSGTLRIPVEQVDRLRADGQCPHGWLRYDLLTGRGDERLFQGQAHLIPDTGISVVSDIDDTLKHSEVTCRRELLTNTFLREFSSIDGMAALFEQWAEQGAAFHYVSSSPWQLYSPLSQFWARSGFPAGSFHLRNFRLRDHMLRRLLRIRRGGKGAVIESILRAFPDRKFLLVGDSGERDPEIYAAVARQFPRQIHRICIRNLPERPMTPLRHDKTYRHLRPEVAVAYRNPEELGEQIGDLSQPELTRRIPTLSTLPARSGQPHAL